MRIDMSELEMPTVCDGCGDLFELNDLRMCFTCMNGSVLRCDSCHRKHCDDHDLYSDLRR